MSLLQKIKLRLIEEPLPKMHHIGRKIDVKQLGIKKVVVVRQGKPDPRYIACEHVNTTTIADLITGDRLSVVVGYRCYCVDCGTYVERTHPAYDLHFDIHINKVSAKISA